MIGKKFLAFSLSAVILAGSAMSASAAGLKDVFNADTYAGNYSDLKTAFGTDAAKLLEHFKAFGAKEGRVASPILDVAAYRKAYADLNAAYGDNWDAYVDHYLKYGINEGRTTGVLFDLVDYANKNADVKAAYGNDYSKIAEHYVTKGINEKRPGGTIAQASASSSNSSSSNSGSSKPATTPAPVVPSGTTNTYPSSGGSTTTTTTTTFEGHTHHLVPTNNSVAGSCDYEGWQEYKCDVIKYRNVVVDGKVTAVVPVTDAAGNVITCDYVERKATPKVHVASAMDGTAANYYCIPATCTVKGIEKYTCARCGVPVVNDLDVIDHVMEKSKTVAPKSCATGNEGYDLYACKFGCGKTEQRNVIKVDHQVAAYDNEVVKPTCTSVGTATGICSKCGEPVPKTIAMLGHNSDGIRTRYVDSYVKGEAERCHTKYEITVCTGCNLIQAVSAPAKDNCSDGNKDGVCDDCLHSMTRNNTNQVMQYIVGDVLMDGVGQ